MQNVVSDYHVIINMDNSDTGKVSVVRGKTRMEFAIVGRPSAALRPALAYLHAIDKDSSIVIVSTITVAHNYRLQAYAIKTGNRIGATFYPIDGRETAERMALAMLLEDTAHVLFD